MKKDFSSIVDIGFEPTKRFIDIDRMRRRRYPTGSADNETTEIPSL